MATLADKRAQEESTVSSSMTEMEREGNRDAEASSPDSHLPNEGMDGIPRRRRQETAHTQNSWKREMSGDTAETHADNHPRTDDLDRETTGGNATDDRTRGPNAWNAVGQIPAQQSPWFKRFFDNPKLIISVTVNILFCFVIIHLWLASGSAHQHYEMAKEQNNQHYELAKADGQHMIKDFVYALQQMNDKSNQEKLDLVKGTVDILQRNYEKLGEESRKSMEATNAENLKMLRFSNDESQKAMQQNIMQQNRKNLEEIKQIYESANEESRKNFESSGEENRKTMGNALNRAQEYLIVCQDKNDILVRRNQDLERKMNRCWC